MPNDSAASSENIGGSEMDIEHLGRDRTVTDSARSLWRVEQIDDRNRKAGKIVEHFNKRLERDNSRLGEAYLKIKSKIVFQRMDGSDCNYGIIFEALPNWSKHNTVFRSFSRYKNRRRCVDYGKKAPVFPREVEFVQSGDVVIPSIVRLEVFDSSLIGNGKPLYFFSSRVRQIVEGIDIVPNGEISIGWVCSAVALGKSDSKDIKTASDAMDDAPASAIMMVGIGFTLQRRMIFLPGCEFRSPMSL